MKSGFDLPPSIVAPRFRDQLDLIEGERIVVIDAGGSGGAAGSTRPAY
jgi:hypothetical protein